MRLPLFAALGSLAMLLCPPTARAQAAAETALTTAASSANTGAVASKIRVPGFNLPSATSPGGTVHRYTHHSGDAATVHHIPAKSTRHKTDAAASHPPRVTYRRVQ